MRRSTEKEGLNLRKFIFSNIELLGRKSETIKTEVSSTSLIDTALTVQLNSYFGGLQVSRQPMTQYAEM